MSKKELATEIIKETTKGNYKNRVEILEQFEWHFVRGHFLLAAALLWAAGDERIIPIIASDLRRKFLGRF